MLRISLLYAIVDAVFRPSMVDDQTVKDILAEINTDPTMKAARNAVLGGKAELKKYKSVVSHQIPSYPYRY